MNINTNYSSFGYTSLLGQNNNATNTLLFASLLSNLANNNQNTTTCQTCQNETQNLESLDNMLNVRNVDLNIGTVSVDTQKNTVSMDNVEINYLGQNITIKNLVINNSNTNQNSSTENNIATQANNNVAQIQETASSITTNQVVNSSVAETTQTQSVTSNSEISSKIQSAINLAKEQLGKDYVWGANGPESFDCSGLTRYLYKEAFGITIPRVSYDQAEYGKEVSKSELQPGDLVFFDTMNKGRVSHVGIYIGNDQFIHAANSKQGVITSNLTGTKYEKEYITATRPYES